MACLLSADSALFKQYRRCYAKHIRPGVIVGVRYFTFEDGFFHGIFYFFDCRGGGYVEILHDFMTVDGDFQLRRASASLISLMRRRKAAKPSSWRRTFAGFFDVMSASASVIRSSRSGPASVMRRRTPESDTPSSPQTAGAYAVLQVLPHISSSRSEEVSSA